MVEDYYYLKKKTENFLIKLIFMVKERCSCVC